jgi:hypothetical protein
MASSLVNNMHFGNNRVVQHCHEVTLDALLRFDFLCGKVIHLELGRCHLFIVHFFILLVLWGIFVHRLPFVRE